MQSGSHAGKRASGTKRVGELVLDVDRSPCSSTPFVILAQLATVARRTAGPDSPAVRFARMTGSSHFGMRVSDEPKHSRTMVSLHQGWRTARSACAGKSRQIECPARLECRRGLGIHVPNRSRNSANSGIALASSCTNQAGQVRRSSTALMAVALSTAASSTIGMRSSTTVRRIPRTAEAVGEVRPRDPRVNGFGATATGPRTNRIRFSAKGDDVGAVVPESDGGPPSRLGKRVCVSHPLAKAPFVRVFGVGHVNACRANVPVGFGVLSHDTIVGEAIPSGAPLRQCVGDHTEHGAAVTGLSRILYQARLRDGQSSESDPGASGPASSSMTLLRVVGR